MYEVTYYAAQKWRQRKCAKVWAGKSSDPFHPASLPIPLFSPMSSASPPSSSAPLSTPSLHTQVRLTGGVQQYLPSFLPPLLGFGPPSPIDRIVVDDERQIMYSLNQASVIQVTNGVGCDPGVDDIGG